MAEARIVEIEFTQFDELPDPCFTVKRDGTAVDLSTTYVASMKIYIARIDATTLIADGIAAIDYDATNGNGTGSDGKITWDVSDTEAVTDEAGRYIGHIVIDWKASPQHETILTQLEINVRPALRGSD